MRAGKTLLEYLVLFKVKLERFLSRETRWVELDLIEVDEDHTALNITSPLQRKYAESNSAKDIQQNSCEKSFDLGCILGLRKPKTGNECSVYR